MKPLRSNWLPRRLPALFTLLLIVALLPVIAVQVLIYSQQSRGRYQQEVEADLELSRAFAAAVDVYLSALGREEEALGRSLMLIGSEDRQGALALLKIHTAEFPSVRGLAYANLSGTVVYASNPDALGVEVADRPYFQEAMNSADAVVGDLMLDKVLHRPVFAVCRRVDKDGVPQGAIIAIIEPQAFGDALQVFERSKEGTLLIVDRQGRLVYRSPRVDLTWDQRMLYEKDLVMTEALKGHEATGEWYSPYDNRLRIVSRVPVPHVGWVVGASRPKSLLMGLVFADLRKVMALNVAAVLLSILLAVLIIRRINRDIRILGAHAAALSRGDMGHQAPLGEIAELRELTGSFNEMARRRKQAEQEIRASEEKYRQLVETAGCVIIRMDVEARVTFFNDFAEKLFGFTKEEVLGRPIYETLVPPADSGGLDLRAMIGDLMRHPGKYVYYENETVARNGRHIWMAWTNRPLVDEGGYVTEILSVGLDFTQRKKAEDTLAGTAAELSRSNMELEQFAYVASHDLQEPLRMVTSYVQLLQQRYGARLGADADEFIHYAVDGATRMQRLINDLLTYSRVGTRGQPAAPTNMKDIVESAVANLQTAIQESEAIITYGGLPVVRGDASQLTQLMQNLLANAIKFRGSRRPEIHVGAQHEDRRWHLWVQDNGIGIDPEQVERIFLIFQRLHTRKQYPGTGIGLAVCKKIVERHGGRIWVESAIGKGATFHFTIPV